MNIGYLADGEFARQHNLSEAKSAEPPDLLGRAIVGLRAGMKRQMRNRGRLLGKMLAVAGKESHILHQNGIDTYLRQLVEQAVGSFQLIVVNYGVDRDIDLRLKLMGIAAELGNVGHAVAGIGACTKAWGSDVNSVGTMVNGCLAALQILGWRQQFEFCHLLRSGLDMKG